MDSSSFKLFLITQSLRSIKVETFSVDIKLINKCCLHILCDLFSFVLASCVLQIVCVLIDDVYNCLDSVFLNSLYLF